jgi:hypothetical protein
MGLLDAEALLAASLAAETKKRKKSKAKRSKKSSRRRWGGDLEAGEKGFDSMLDRVDDALALDKGSKVGKGKVSLRGRGKMSIGAHKMHKYGIRDKSGKKSKGKKSKGKKKRSKR